MFTDAFLSMDNMDLVEIIYSAYTNSRQENVESFLFILTNETQL